MKKCSFFHAFSLFFYYCGNVRSDVFTALSDLEQLLETENLLLNSLDDYIKAEETKIEFLKRYRQIYRRHYDQTAGNAQYVTNPLNAYILIKKLTTDWTEVETLISTNVSLDFLVNITHIKGTNKFPTDEDLNGAAVALTRLQDTYRLDTSSLARGELNGIKYSSEWSAADCFELGRQSYRNGDFYHTVLWMTEADSRLTGDTVTVTRSDILDYLAFSAYKQGNTSLALDLTEQLLDIVPMHERALKNKEYYENELQNGKQSEDRAEPLDRPFHFHHELCRGELSLPDEERAKLKCRYWNKNHPFLLLAPFKVEEAHHQPDIFIFRDVLADSEIETIKTLATPSFERAMVHNKEGKPELAHYRISKSAWLNYDDHKHIAGVTQRVADMTGLTMETAELLQIANYGIGGHYEPHFDFAKKDELEPLEAFGVGNRIATVLFYMSDVAQGGATVFPKIHVALWPQKGSAAFWYNLHLSGDGDNRMQHAACPVLMGSKWVATKWIHEVGQEFRRPCSSERPSEDLVA